MYKSFKSRLGYRMGIYKNKKLYKNILNEQYWESLILIDGHNYASVSSHVPLYDLNVSDISLIIISRTVTYTHTKIRNIATTLLSKSELFSISPGTYEGCLKGLSDNICE